MSNDITSALGMRLLVNARGSDNGFQERVAFFGVPLMIGFPFSCPTTAGYQFSCAVSAAKTNSYRTENQDCGKHETHFLIALT